MALLKEIENLTFRCGSPGPVSVLLTISVPQAQIARTEHCSWLQSCCISSLGNKFSSAVPSPPFPSVLGQTTQRMQLRHQSWVRGRGLFISSVSVSSSPCSIAGAGWSAEPHTVLHMSHHGLMRQQTSPSTSQCACAALLLLCSAPLLLVPLFLPEMRQPGSQSNSPDSPASNAAASSVTQQWRDTVAQGHVGLSTLGAQTPRPEVNLSSNNTSYSRVVVIPDLHGDLQQARLLLQLAGVTDKVGMT